MKDPYLADFAHEEVHLGGCILLLQAGCFKLKHVLVSLDPKS